LRQLRDGCKTINARETEPAKPLAVFVVDTKDAASPVMTPCQE
jgi:hypothetical protein